MKSVDLSGELASNADNDIDRLRQVLNQIDTNYTERPKPNPSPQAMLAAVAAHSAASLLRRLLALAMPEKSS